MNAVEATAENTISDVVLISLGRVDKFQQIVELVLSFLALSCRRNIKLCHLHNHMGDIPEDLGDVKEDVKAKVKASRCKSKSKTLPRLIKLKLIRRLLLELNERCSSNCAEENVKKEEVLAAII